MGVKRGRRNSERLEVYFKFEISDLKEMSLLTELGGVFVGFLQICRAYGAVLRAQGRAVLAFGKLVLTVPGMSGITRSSMPKNIQIDGSKIVNKH